MGRKINPETLRDILIHLERDTGLRAISRLLKCSRNTVRRIELSMDLYDTPYPPHSMVRGRPKLLLMAQEQALLQFVQEKPSAHLNEMREYLIDNFNVLVGEGTIYRTLRKAGWSRKVALRHAKARSDRAHTTVSPRPDIIQPKAEQNHTVKIEHLVLDHERSAPIPNRHL
ncbi:hypothetical protein OPT61_g8235 [Boeremia exigua]|uniref:Uncharacterized protein n=1 Tax=Boeremia exigua TaxID=749465 RepID=A0ACC2HZ15_9PLEO|nr:hypothetical protein OPT61_g8235 [Boeremia exigua]